jgi:hypothetical protein
MPEPETSQTATAALAFFVNSDCIKAELSNEQPVDETVLAAVTERLRALSDDDLKEALGDAASVLVAEYPALGRIQSEALKGQEVRGGHLPDPAAIQSMLEFLRDYPGLIPVIAIALRIIGENRVKFGKFELKTGSVLKDLASVIKFWK